MASIRIEASDETEALLQFIANELDDATLDGIEIKREIARSANLATEPLTVAATVTLTTAAIVAVSRIIERWMENHKQTEHLRIIAEGFTQSDEAGKALAEVGKAYSKVSIAYGIPKPTTRK